MICNRKNWGNPLWCILHLLTILIDMESIENMKMLLEDLQHLIPCQKCRYNYKIKLKKYLKNGELWKDIIFKHKKILIYSLIIIHEEINIDNNKKSDSIQQHYKFWLNRKNKKKLLEIYIQNLKLCANIDKNLILQIENIKTIDID